MSEGFKGVSFKSAKVGQDKKGRNTLALNLSQEDAANLLEKVAALQGNERGVKISVTYYEVDKAWGPSISAFAYVDPIEAPGANYSKQGGKPQQGRFVPKAKSEATATSATNRARAASALNTEIE
jgi:hypothetical protein